MLAEIARELLNKRLHDPESPTPDTVGYALKGLSKLEWQLHQAPWQHFLLVPSTTRTGLRRWVMRNEDRPKVVRLGQIIQQWILGVEYDNRDRAEDLKSQWKSFLILGDPPLSAETVDDLWLQVKDKKSAMAW